MVGLWVVAGLVFAAIAAVVAAIAGAGRRPPTLADEIARYGRAAPRPGTPGERTSAPVLKELLGLARGLVRGEERVALDLERAGLRLRPHEWLVVRCGVGAGCALVLLALTGNPLLAPPFGALLGWAGPRLFLSARVTRRLNAFADQLPDALQLIASSLRAGFTVAQSLDRIAQQEVQPLAAEMARTVARTRLGVGIEDSLDQVAGRMDCRDLAWVVMAIRIQREVGGNLADVIETTIGTMRERTRLRRHVRALSAEGRLSAYLLIALPVVVGGFLVLFRPAYVTPLFRTPLGLALLLAAGLLMTGGWFWMSRVIKVEP